MIYLLLFLIPIVAVLAWAARLDRKRVGVKSQVTTSIRRSTQSGKTPNERTQDGCRNVTPRQGQGGTEMSWLTWPARRVRAMVLLCQATAAQRQGDLWAKDAGGMSSGYFALVFTQRQAREQYEHAARLQAQADR